MIRDSIFDAKPGFVAGPYLHDRIYKLARVMEFVNISDSVRARHILISLSVQRDDARAKTIADSLLQLINRGADFNTLALQYSADESNKAIGGDLGWFREGQMVKPFNDACFNAKPGDVKVVKTNYGYHVIRLEAQSPMVRKVKVAFLEREITPSDETTQEIYSKAVSFAAASGNIDEFRNTCRKENITPRFASDINPADKTLPGLENAREIIRWAFENDEGAVSSIFDMSDKYIIAALSGLKQKGYASVESVKAEIEIALKKQKKLEKLAADIKTRTSSAGSIDEIATILGSEVSEATEVRFTNPYISNVGIEPAVVVHAFNLPAGSLSEPVIGENGVFVLTVNNIISPENPNVFSARLRLKYALDGRATYEGYEALKTSANITDNRIKFF
jgi:peptidyl-prolyl cis-trans isomerase D